jgi:hypothetical protein
MRKKGIFYVENFLPESEKDALLKIMQEAEEQERKEQEENDDYIAPSPKQEKPAAEPTDDDEKVEEEKPEHKGNSDVLKDKMLKYLQGQFKDLREGLELIAEEFDAESINTCIDSFQYDDTSWEKLLILEAWGDKE